MSKNERPNFEIIEDSMELDTEIYVRLSGILINEVLQSNPDSISSSLNITEICKNFDTNDSTAEDNSLNKEHNKKIISLVTLFDLVNKERVALRSILIKLIKKKFWKLKLNKQNSNFFINKTKGINIEVLKKRILDLESKIKEKDIRIKENDKILDELKNKNNLHLQTIRKQTNYLKDSILNGSIINADVMLNNNIDSSNINNNSINNNSMLKNYGSNEIESENKSNKSKRKIRRRNSTSNFHDLKMKKEVPKQSLFKNQKKERIVTQRRRVSSIHKGSFNLKFNLKKEKEKKEGSSEHNIYDSNISSSGEDYNVRKQIFRGQQTYR